MYTVKQSINFNQNDQVALLIGDVAFAAWCVWTFQTCQFLFFFLCLFSNYKGRNFKSPQFSL